MAGLESRQDLPADPLEDFLCRPRRILEVEADVVDARRSQPFQVAQDVVPAGAEAEVERPGRTARIFDQIEIQRLGEWLESPRRRRSHRGPPACGELGLPP